MAEEDSWEDWEEAAEVPQLPKLPGAAGTATAAAPDEDKFAGEDEGEDEPAYSVPETQQPKKAAKPKYEDKGAVLDDTPLDDPIAEKLRKQRLVEDADLRTAQELFGTGGELDVQKLKTLKEHETYGKAVAAKFLRQHEGSTHYKGLLKALLKSALAALPAQETKDIETAIAGLRADKVKADAAAAAAAKKAGKKKNLNVGSKGGSAGLDDYVFDSAAGPDDEYDFM